MKKNKPSINKQKQKRSSSLSAKERFVFGLEGSFIMVFGGGFLVIILGMMIFY